MPRRRTLGLKLDALWQRAVEPVFVLNRRCRLVYVNRSWEELTGRTVEAARGLRCHAGAKHTSEEWRDLALCHCPPRDGLQRNQPGSARVRIVHTDGNARVRIAEFWPFTDAEGQRIGFFGMFRNEPDPIRPLAAYAEEWIPEVLRIQTELLARKLPATLIGRGPWFERLLAQMDVAAKSDCPVLIRGESGTGKHLVARTIHRAWLDRLKAENTTKDSASASANNASQIQGLLIPLDCTALPPDVLEDELLGDRAQSRWSRPGTALLLKDVLSLPRDLQVRLGERWFRPGGGPVPRLIALTSENWESALQEGRVIPLFAYGISPITVTLLPLRQRREELPLLAQALLERANQSSGGRAPTGWTAEALDTLQSYDWPGNLRELLRIIETIRRDGQADPIPRADIPADIQGVFGTHYPPPPPPSFQLEEHLAVVEKRRIEQALKHARHNKSRAAELLGISRPRLYRRVKELGIQWPDDREPQDETT